MGKPAPRHAGPSRLGNLWRLLREGRFQWRQAWELSLARLPPFTHKTLVVFVAVLVVSLALIGGIVELFPPATMEPDRPAARHPNPPATTATAVSSVTGRPTTTAAGSAAVAVVVAPSARSNARTGKGKGARPLAATTATAATQPDGEDPPATTASPAVTSTTRRSVVPPIPPVSVPPVSVPLLP